MSGRGTDKFAAVGSGEAVKLKGKGAGERRRNRTDRSRQGLIGERSAEALPSRVESCGIGRRVRQSRARIGGWVRSVRSVRAGIGWRRMLARIGRRVH